MAETSPILDKINLNKSTIITRGLSLKTNNDIDSDDESPDTGKRVKLPEIILNKLKTTKATEGFDNIPGFKSNKTAKAQAKPTHRRAMTEK